MRRLIFDRSPRLARRRAGADSRDGARAAGFGASRPVEDVRMQRLVFDVSPRTGADSRDVARAAGLGASRPVEDVLMQPLVFDVSPRTARRRDLRSHARPASAPRCAPWGNA